MIADHTSGNAGRHSQRFATTFDMTRQQTMYALHCTFSKPNPRISKVIITLFQLLYFKNLFTVNYLFLQEIQTSCFRITFVANL